MSKSERHQVGLTVGGNIKRVYDAATGPGGLNATRMFQAGFLHLIKIPQMQRPALFDLKEFEEQGEWTDEMAIDFVVGRRDLSLEELRNWMERSLIPVSHRLLIEARVKRRR